MFSSFLGLASSLKSIADDGGSVVASSLFRSFDLSCFLPADCWRGTKGTRSAAPPGRHCGIFLLRPVFVRPSSGLLSSSLFRQVGYSGLFQQGVSDFFWLGSFWMALWRGITVVLERSEFSAQPPRWGCSISCRGRCFKETLLREYTMCQNILELVAPGWSNICYTLHLKLIGHGGYQNWHFNWQYTVIKKQLNDNRVQLKVQVRPLIHVFEYFNLPIYINNGSMRLASVWGRWGSDDLLSGAVTEWLLFSPLPIVFPSVARFVSRYRFFWCSCVPEGQHGRVTGLVLQHRSGQYSICSVRDHFRCISNQEERNGNTLACGCSVRVRVQNLLQC